MTMLSKQFFQAQRFGAACGAMVIAAVLGSSSPSSADYQVTTKCARGTCTETFREIGPAIGGIARVVSVAGARDAAADERDRRWLERCRPTLRQDSYGVSRYYYAASNCDLGKFSD